MADSAHGGQESLEPGRVGVDRLKERETAGLGLVLQFSGAKTLGQAAPKRVEPVISHFQHSAEIGRFPAVEKHIGGRRVVIDAVPALQKSEGNQCVEEVLR